jgi:hypothetical protein
MEKMAEELQEQVTEINRERKNFQVTSFLLHDLIKFCDIEYFFLLDWIRKPNHSSGTEMDRLDLKCVTD